MAQSRDLVCRRCHMATCGGACRWRPMGSGPAGGNPYGPVALTATILRPQVWTCTSVLIRKGVDPRSTPLLRRQAPCGPFFLFLTDSRNSKSTQGCGPFAPWWMTSPARRGKGLVELLVCRCWWRPLPCPVGDRLRLNPTGTHVSANHAAVPFRRRPCNVRPTGGDLLRGLPLAADGAPPATPRYCDRVASW